MTELAKTTEFFREPDPVRAFFLGAQRWLMVPQTAVWDEATHHAYWAYIKEVDPTNAPTETPWGVDPQRFAYLFSALVDGSDDREDFGPVQKLLVALGFPATSYDQYALYVGSMTEADKVLLGEALTRVDDAVRAAERTAVPVVGNGLVPESTTGTPLTPTGTPLTPVVAAKKWPTWAKVAVGVGAVATVGAVIYLLIQARKRQGLEGLGCGCEEED